MNKRIGTGLLTMAAIVAAIWACMFQVAENEYAVVARLGDPRRVIDQAGLHFKWPPPFDSVIRIDGRVHVLDPESDEYLTGDKKNVNVDSFMAWRVEDPIQFLVSVTSLRGAEARLTDVLRSVVGDVLGAHNFSTLVSSEERETTMSGVVDRITEMVASRAKESFGVRVEVVRIKRLNFPSQNKKAVFQRMEAERSSFAAQYRSEGLEQYEKIKAEADRVEAELISEAERKAREIRGQADAEAAEIYARAYGQDPEFYEFLRSLEVLDKVLGYRSTMIVPSDHELIQVLHGPTERSTAATGGSGKN